MTTWTDRDGERKVYGAPGQWLPQTPQMQRVPSAKGEDTAEALSLAEFQKDIRERDGGVQWALGYFAGTEFEAKAGKIAKRYDEAKAELAKFEGKAQSAMTDLDNLKGNI